MSQSWEPARAETPAQGLFLSPHHDKPGSAEGLLENGRTGHLSPIPRPDTRVLPGVACLPGCRPGEAAAARSHPQASCPEVAGLGSQLFGRLPMPLGPSQARGPVASLPEGCSGGIPEGPGGREEGGDWRPLEWPVAPPYTIQDAQRGPQPGPHALPSSQLQASFPCRSPVEGLQGLGHTRPPRAPAFCPHYGGPLLFSAVRCLHHTAAPSQPSFTVSCCPWNPSAKRAGTSTVPTAAHGGLHVLSA